MSSCQDILEFEVPGELVQVLFQLLAVVDVYLLEVLDFCLNCLQLGKQLEDREGERKPGLP